MSKLLPRLDPVAMSLLRHSSTVIISKGLLWNPPYLIAAVINSNIIYFKTWNETLHCICIFYVKKLSSYVGLPKALWGSSLCVNCTVVYAPIIEDPAYSGPKRLCHPLPRVAL